MTGQELKDEMSSRISRGVIVHGFGMVDLFVPVKSVENIKQFVGSIFPAGVYNEVKPLNMQMKKGVLIYKVQDLPKHLSDKLYNRGE